jgi:hypothetical protein
LEDFRVLRLAESLVDAAIGANPYAAELRRLRGEFGDRRRNVETHPAIDLHRVGERTPALAEYAGFDLLRRPLHILQAGAAFPQVGTDVAHYPGERDAEQVVRFLNHRYQRNTRERKYIDHKTSPC